jgi:hypothetical protein
MPMAILKSVTAYNGRFILEYSEVVKGKPQPRFAIQPPPDGPVTGGNSLKEVKQVIDGLAKASNHGYPFSGLPSSTIL